MPNYRKFMISRISFDVKEKGKKKESKMWTLVHNLHEFGYADITPAFDNYIAREDHPTPEGLCEYIRSKDVVNILCWTENQFKELFPEVYKSMKIDVLVSKPTSDQ